MTDTLRKAAQDLIERWYRWEHEDRTLPPLSVLREPIEPLFATLRTALAQPEDVMVRFSRINQEMENTGLLHDKAHTDTGKTRAAQSVRTPEMSYRPGSLPMEDEPVGWIYKFGKTTFLAKLPLTDEYIAGGWTAEPVFTRPQPLRELSDEEIDACFESVMFDPEVPASRELIARAIIDAARKA